MDLFSTNKKILTAALIVYVSLFASGVTSHSAEKPLMLHIYPYAPAEEIIKQFTPLAQYLTESLKRKVEINVSKGQVEHLESIGNDSSDIVYLGPVAYVQLVDKYGKKPVLARLEIRGSPLLRGVVFTSSSSSVRSLKDLKGKRFAFGYRNSTMSHIVPFSMLLDEGVSLSDLQQYKFLSDQHNVALGVLMGDYDAGAANESIFQSYKSRGLKELARTPEVSEHLFIARSTLSAPTINALRKALFAVKDAGNAQSILSPIKEGMTALAPVDDRDYDNLRELLQKLKESRYMQ